MILKVSKIPLKALDFSHCHSVLRGKIREQKSQWLHSCLMQQPATVRDNGREVTIRLDEGCQL